MSEALLQADATEIQINEALDQFDSALEHYRPQISEMVKLKGVNPDEFIASLKNSVKIKPTLLECTIQSLMGATLTSAELGLIPNNPFQLSHIIPYNVNKGDQNNKRYVKEAQFQIGYQGWFELFNRHPKISHVDCQLVFENDVFKQTKGNKPELIHEPFLDPTEKGERIGTYAIAWLKDVEHPTWVFVHKTEIMAIKKKSPGAYYRDGNENMNSPWNPENDPMGWMWMKVAIKQLSKKLPKTREIELSIYAQDVEETGKVIRVDEQTQALKLDPITTVEDKNKDRTETKNAAVAAGMKDMLTPNKDLETRRKVAIKMMTKKYGVSEDQLCKRLKIENVELIDEPELDQLTEIRDEAKKRGVKVIEFFKD